MPRKKKRPTTRSAKLRARSGATSSDDERYALARAEYAAKLGITEAEIYSGRRQVVGFVTHGGGIPKNSKAGRVVWYREGKERGRPLNDPPAWIDEETNIAAGIEYERIVNNLARPLTKAERLRQTVQRRASELRASGTAQKDIASTITKWLLKTQSVQLTLRRVQQILKTSI